MSGSNTWLMNAIEWGVYPNTGGGGSGPYVKLTATSNQIIAGAYALGANILLPGFQTIVTSGGTTALTAGSPQVTNLTGTFSQTVTLPDVTTLASVSTSTTPYTFINRSSGTITVNSFDGSLVSTILPNSTFTFYCISNTGNTASSWSTTSSGAAVLLAPSGNQTIAGNFLLQAYQLRATNSLIVGTLQPQPGVTGLQLINAAGTPVNNLTITNAASGNYPTLGAAGPAADIGVQILTKGLGNILARTNALTNQLVVRASTNTNNLSFPAGTATTNTYVFPDVGGSSTLATTANVIVKAPIATQLITGAYSLGANNLLPGYLEVPVTFGSYSLTVASPQILNFTGAFGGYDIVMPDVTTLTSITTNTTPYTLTNNTPSPAFVKSFNGAAIADIPAYGSINLYLKSNTDNTAAGWNIFGGGSPVVLNPTANQIIQGAYGLYLNGGNFIAGTLAGAQFSRPGNIQSIGDASAAQFLATGYNNNGTSYLSYVTSEAIGASSLPLPDNAPLGVLEFAGDDGSGDGGPVSVKLDLKCAGTSSLGIVPSQATFSTSNQSNGLQPVWLADNTQNFNLYQGLTVVRGGLIGGTTGMYAFGVSGQFEAISGTSGGQIISSGFNATEPGFINTCSNTSVLGTYVPVTPDQALGYWAAQGDDGFSYSAIAGYAEWTVDTGAVISQNVVPGRFTLYTTNSSGSPTPAFYADSLQNFVLPQGVLEIGTPAGSPASRATLYSTTAALGSFSIFSNNNAGDFANFLTTEITTDARSWFLPDRSGIIAIDSRVQENSFNFGVAFGVADAFAVDLTPGIGALTNGLTVLMSSGLLGNTISAPTLQVNGLTPVDIVLADGPLAPNDISPGGTYFFVYNASSNEFVLINPSFSTANTFAVQANAYNTAIDIGTADALDVNLNPTLLSAVNVGFPITVLPAASSTGGAVTITVDGTVYDVFLANGSDPVAGDIVVNRLAQLVYSSALVGFVLMNPQSPAITQEAWVDQTTTPVTMVSNTGYTSDAGASLVTFTLPTVSAVGDFVEINGNGTGKWIIAQAAGQQIQASPLATTSGTGGSLAAVNRYDNVRLRCIVANTIWTVVSQQSTGLTIV